MLSFSSFRSSRVFALASALTLAVGLAACGEEDPIGPGIGFPETGRFSGTLNADASRDLTGVIANRSGTLQGRACFTQGATVDVVATNAAGNDTVGTVTSANGCASVTLPVVEGGAYRLRLRNSGTTQVAYVVCWAYDAATCADLAVIPPDGEGVPAGYYLRAEGLRDTALIRVLHEIIRGQRQNTYTNARDSLYRNVEDPDDDNVITDLYNARTVTVTGIGDCATCSNTLNLNAEHLWPQSRGANELPAESDLHSLWAADEGANQLRGNLPFGIVTTVQNAGPLVNGEQWKLGTNANGVQVFEPRNSTKGDIARALLYFYVRYKPQPTPSFTLQNFNLEEAILRQWAQADPVSAFERARNNEVYQAQGNRNPFIDRPEFLTAIADFPNQ